MITTPRRRARDDASDARRDATTTTTTTAAEASYEEDEAEPPRRRGTTTTFPLACPVSLKALRGDGVEPTSGLRYEEREGRWDLTVGAAENARSGARVGSLVDLAREALPNELKGLLPTSGYFGTATFETPQVAFAYERGWRDSFKRAGFPGPDEEARLAVDALGEFAKGGIVVDASCGSGLFTRRFLKTKAYRGVVALDYSDAMLATSEDNTWRMKTYSATRTCASCARTSRGYRFRKARWTACTRAPPSTAGRMPRRAWPRSRACLNQARRSVERRS